MKKLFISGALAIASFSFANTKETTIDVPVVTSEILVPSCNTEVKEMTKEQKQALIAFLKQWWGVTIGTPCGQVNVNFTSVYEIGTQEFIHDLAYAVNYSYDHCGYAGSPIELN